MWTDRPSGLETSIRLTFTRNEFRRTHNSGLANSEGKEGDGSLRNLSKNPKEEKTRDTSEPKCRDGNGKIKVPVGTSVVDSSRLYGGDEGSTRPDTRTRLGRPYDGGVRGLY